MDTACVDATIRNPADPERRWIGSFRHANGASERGQGEFLACERGHPALASPFLTLPCHCARVNGMALCFWLYGDRR